MHQKTLKYEFKIKRRYYQIWVSLNLEHSTFWISKYHFWTLTLNSKVLLKHKLQNSEISKILLFYTKTLHKYFKIVVFNEWKNMWTMCFSFGLKLSSPRELIFPHFFCRQDVHCFGDDTCYSLAFGVPAILMAVATVILVIGKNMYVHKPPQGSVLTQVVGSITVRLLIC